MHPDPPSPATPERADALEVLFERPGLPEWPLPAPLVARYGRHLGLPRPGAIANSVASLDGVVALPRSDESGHVISGDSEADRFVMGLLRACADGVLIGAGTFRKARGQMWRAEAIYPAAAALFEETRARLGLERHPRLVVVTGSGDIDGDEPALVEAMIVTTPEGQARLRSRVPSSTRILVLDAEGGGLALGRVLDRLRAEGLGLLLVEGGPSLVAELLSQRLLDELFLTSSPAFFGRYPGDQRKSLVDGRDLAGARADLLSVRRSGSHLFLRYAVERA